MEQNIFVEGGAARAIQRAAQRRGDGPLPASRSAAQARIVGPTLSWPRNIPIEGEPADVVAIVEEYGEWLSHSDVPKLFINAEPGALIRGRVRDFVRTWPNQTEVTVPGVHFVQEDSPDEIGAAVASFVRAVRAAG